MTFLSSRSLRTNGKACQDRYGWIPDIDAVLQLKVIEKVFQACDTIIAATDASREGEMIFRYLYQYLDCTQPCFRLWISSLTDEAVRGGMENLKPDSCYDSDVPRADSRNKADWLLGMNASYAICKATGREQFPRTGADTRTGCHQQTLPREGEPYRDGQLALSSSACTRTISSSRCAARQDLPDREPATILRGLQGWRTGTYHRSVSRQVKEIEPPALYNLTELQKDANFRMV